MAEPETLCERLDAIQEALRTGREALSRLKDGESGLSGRIAGELADAAAELAHRAESLYALLKESFCRG